MPVIQTAGPPTAVSASRSAYASHSKCHAAPRALLGRAALLCMQAAAGQELSRPVAPQRCQTAAAMLLAYVLLAMTVCSPLARAQLTPASNPVPTNLESGLLTDLANRNNTGSQGPVGSGNSTSSASDGYFDATTVIPPSQLGWLLTPPPGGWQEWSAPASDSGGVSAAAGGGVARPEADPAGLSRVSVRCSRSLASLPLGTSKAVGCGT